MYDYFYRQQAELFSFYRVPKVLFTDEKFSNISSDAKLLYGIMLDRMNLSAKATVMAVVNQKGRTGKTTTCENLGVGLAMKGKKCFW